jgi:hypothetical protein
MGIIRIIFTQFFQLSSEEQLRTTQNNKNEIRELIYLFSIIKFK